MKYIKSKKVSCADSFTSTGANSSAFTCSCFETFGFIRVAKDDCEFLGDMLECTNELVSVTSVTSQKAKIKFVFSCFIESYLTFF